jgi:hypothetical protein
MREVAGYAALIIIAVPYGWLLIPAVGWVLYRLLRKLL